MNADDGTVREAFAQCARGCPVVRIRLLAEHRRAWINETAEVIHVPVRIVTGYALSEPEDVRHAKMCPQTSSMSFLSSPGLRT